jgi:hypothetical protein
MRAARLRRLMNPWPPFLANGMRVLDISNDWSRAEVALRRRLRNREQGLSKPRRACASSFASG